MINATSAKKAKEIVYATSYGDIEEPLYEEWIAEELYSNYGTAKVSNIEVLMKDDLELSSN